MTPAPMVCHPGDDLNKTLDIMSSHQIRRIPVVDEHGQIVGIITRADVEMRLNDHDRTGKLVGQISQPDLVGSLMQNHTL